MQPGSNVYCNIPSSMCVGVGIYVYSKREIEHINKCVQIYKYMIYKYFYDFAEYINKREETMTSDTPPEIEKPRLIGGDRYSIRL